MKIAVVTIYCIGIGCDDVCETVRDCEDGNGCASDNKCVHRGKLIGMEFDTVINETMLSTDCSTMRRIRENVLFIVFYNDTDFRHKKSTNVCLMFLSWKFKVCVRKTTTYNTQQQQ